MILAVLSVILMSVQAKLIGPDYHPVQIAFVRGIVVLILLTPLVYKLGGITFLKTKTPFLHHCENTDQCALHTTVKIQTLDRIELQDTKSNI